MKNYKKDYKRKILTLILISTMGVPVIASNGNMYLTEEEYNDILKDNYIEDYGIVVANEPNLGYLVYKNENGDEITCPYYKEEVVVEKQPYYEAEDRIGYIDELFPNFKYDPRDISITSIKAGDTIYIRRQTDGTVTYINAYNDYLMRYAKVVGFVYDTAGNPTITLEDESGNVYFYEVPLNTPVTKGGNMIAISAIKTGDWVKVLVSQKILGIGSTNEEIMEIVVDNGSRYIENLYRGQVLKIDTFNKVLNLKSTQELGKAGWGPYNSLTRVSIDEDKTKAYLIGNRISFDYINRYMRNSEGYAYVATENYKGKESAVKLNFQSKSQSTLPTSMVIYTNGNMIKLLSGETIYIAEDAIIVRDKRLVDGNSIMVGDNIQAVVTGENKLAVGNIVNKEKSSALEVYRGRISKIDDREEFKVETFSLLQGTTWYYHPTPNTFTIDDTTKFYSKDGYVAGGIETFIGYGEDSLINQVFTIVADGGHAQIITDSLYSTEAVKGEVYKVDENSIAIKDVYYFDNGNKIWREYSRKNMGATVQIEGNTTIIKDGEAVPARMLEPGDKVSVITDVSLKSANGNVKGYIIQVEN